MDAGEVQVLRLLSLPGEVLQQIVGHLPLADRLACTLVCRRLAAEARTLVAGPMGVHVQLTADRQKYNDTVLAKGVDAWDQAVKTVHVEITDGDPRRLGVVLCSLPSITHITLSGPSSVPHSLLRAMVTCLGPTLTHLTLDFPTTSGTEILFLNGLGQCPVLTRLSVSMPKAAVGGLPPLPNLVGVTIGCHVTDKKTLAAIGQCTAMTALTLRVTDMGAHKIPNLSACRHLSKVHVACQARVGRSAPVPIVVGLPLTSLLVAGYHPFLMSDLEGLATLTSLVLQDLPATDLTPLAHSLPRLANLTLAGILLPDLSFLACRPSLTSLILTHIGPDAFPTFPPLPSLSTLGLSFCGATDLDFLPATCTRLDTLSLVLMYNLTTLSALSVCGGLTSLSIQACRRLTDFTPLGDLPELELIRLVLVEIADVTPLARLPRLGRALFSGVPCSDFGPLRDAESKCEVTLLTSIEAPSPTDTPLVV